MLEIIFHPDAQREYLQALSWYQVRDVDASVRFENEIDASLIDAANHPHRFPKYDDIRRFIVLHYFPYTIIYQANSTQLRVVAIAHHARHPDYWQNRVNDNP